MRTEGRWKRNPRPSDCGFVSHLMLLYISVQNLRRIHICRRGVHRETSFRDILFSVFICGAMSSLFRCVALSEFIQVIE